MRSKKLKSWGSSKRSEKRIFWSETGFRGRMTLVLINPSVWLLESLAKVEDKKEKSEELKGIIHMDMKSLWMMAVT